jgi:hypothetical protein
MRTPLRYYYIIPLFLRNKPLQLVTITVQAVKPERVLYLAALLACQEMNLVMALQAVQRIDSERTESENSPEDARYDARDSQIVKLHPHQASLGKKND